MFPPLYLLMFFISTYCTYLFYVHTVSALNILPASLFAHVYLEEPVRVASPTRINLEEPVRVASPTRINLKEPIRVANPTRINLEEPVRVASPTRINLEELVRMASPNEINLFLCLSVSKG